MDDQSTVFTSPYLAATACCCPGRLGRTALGPGCSTRSGGAPQPLRPQGQLMVCHTSPSSLPLTIQAPSCATLS